MQSIRLQPMRLAPSKGKAFLKWAGGKTRYAAELARMAPNYSGRYFEPFLGSGAVFFEHCPSDALLSDTNEELVVCFREVARDPHAVMACLDQHPNERAHFLAVRAQDPTTLTSVERAARVIFLNKTSFRGLWRVNRRGEFNTPYGAYDRPYYNRETLLSASFALSGVELRIADFENVLDGAQRGDWAFLDPPYVPLGGWADFKRYTRVQFEAADHERLCAAMIRASDRGVFLTLTNSDTSFVHDLFSQHFIIHTMATRRDINLNSAGRGSSDVVVVNYDIPVNSQLTILDEASA